MLSDLANLGDKIKAEAIRLGFSLCGFTTPESPIGYERFEQWLSKGQHAGMVYLESPRHRMMRQSPSQLVPEVKTIISLAWPYSLNRKSDDKSSNEALIAGYVADIDYHHLLITKLDQLINFIQLELNQKFNAQAFTDSAPILEREIASRAGLGWIGKNACLINPSRGSAFLLAELFIDIPLQPDQPFSHDRCGTCHRCVDACPTGCIQDDRTIDSSRCISYLTIENRGNIPDHLRLPIGKWLFGCDVCQTVCPWNRINQDSQSSSINQTCTVEEVQTLLTFSIEEFSSRYKTTALFRSKLKGMQRNALIWLGNNGNEAHSKIIETFLQKAEDPDLIDTANWSFRNITNGIEI
jgi:epoxyqueuosine reductase